MYSGRASCKDAVRVGIEFVNRNGNSGGVKVVLGGEGVTKCARPDGWPVGP